MDINKGQGVTVGYKTTDLSLAIGISSEEAYDAEDDDENAVKGSYAVSADLGVNVGPAELEVSFVQGLESEDDANLDGANDTGIGVKLITTFDSIEHSGGADEDMTGESDLPGTPETSRWTGKRAPTLRLR